MKCPRCNEPLKETYSREGVFLDYCDKCAGTWFDEGELNYFSRDPKKLNDFIRRGLSDEHDGHGTCPRCTVAFREGGLIEQDLLVDRCPSCGGLWLDKGELGRLESIEAKHLDAHRAPAFQPPTPAPDPDKHPTGVRHAPAHSSFPFLPNLYLRSSVVLVLLYGFLFGIMVIAVEIAGVGIHVAFLGAFALVLLSYLAGPYVMDFFLRVAQSTRWLHREEIPSHLAIFIDRLSREHRMPFPRMGLIDDGTPNAFTYGHTPRNARLILTRGLMHKLSPAELEAVVAHELGHAVHWDILVMTMASFVPMLLYYIFRICVRAGGESRGKPLLVIGIIAFLFYIVSEYIILYLSRTREYWADRFSGEKTRKPAHLASALVKVAYGLAAEEQPSPGADKRGEAARPTRTMALRPLGIFDPVSAKCLVATSLAGTQINADGQTDEENVVGAMQWDLWNPWAKFYELSSTHPLPAKRIHALGKHSQACGQEPYVLFNKRQPESYWDEFLVDVFVYLLPVIGIAAGLAHFFLTGIPAPAPLGIMLALFGISSLAKTLYRYPSTGFFPHSVSSLLKKVKVSAVRAIPVTLSGRIIGRGVPGLIFSEDLVMQDKTGFMFLDYRQPLRILEFFFGLFRSRNIIGKDVTIQGWYRRAPMPYVEMKSISFGPKKYRCYVFHAKLVIELALVALGLFMATSLF